MTAKSPDVSLIKLENTKKKSFPGAYDYRIYMTKKAYEEISAHASSDTSIEIGGVMLGNIFHDNSGCFLEVTNVIKATNTESTVSNVTFTHETWADIINKKDAKFPDKIIVGWYHSHPDFDIFLSQQDLHIHENFFNQAHQVAFVIDPIKKKEGFFIWKNGKAKPLDLYWVGNERKFSNTEDPPVEPLDDEKEAEEGKEDVPLLETILKWAAIVLYIGTLVFLMVTCFRSNYYLAAANQEISQIKNENQQLKLLLNQDMSKGKNDMPTTNPAGIGQPDNSTGSAISTPEPEKKNTQDTKVPTVKTDGNSDETTGPSVKTNGNSDKTSGGGIDKITGSAVNSSL